MSPRLVTRIARGEDLASVALSAIATLLGGAAIYGVAFGLWRAPIMALFSAIKLPLLFVATVLASVVLSVVLAALLRAPLSFRQSAVCVLVGLATTATALAALAPVGALIALSVAPPAPGLVGHPETDPAVVAANTHAQGILLFHVAAIATAGVLGNLRLFALLRKLSGRSDVAGRVLIAWLGAQLFVGSELSWILRPFLGRPHFAPSFFADEPLAGSFYEEVGAAMVNALGLHGVAAVGLSVAAVLGLAWLTHRYDGVLVAVAREGRGLRVKSDEATWHVGFAALAGVERRRARAWLVDVWEVVLDVGEGPRLLVRFDAPEEADALVHEVERGRASALEDGPFR